MEYESKKLRGIIDTYKEKKGDKLGINADMGSNIIAGTQEMVERDKVQKLLHQCISMFQLAYREQTTLFERHLQNRHMLDNAATDFYTQIFQKIDLDEDLNQVTKKLEFLEKQNLIEGDSADRHFDSHFGLLQHVYMPTSDSKDNMPISYSVSGGSGGMGDDEVQVKNIEKYEPRVRMYHSYFLATLLNFRSMGHIVCDFCLVILTMIFFFGGMSALVNKNVIEDYHKTWAIYKDDYLWP